MPTTFIGLSSTPRKYKSHAYKCNTAGLKEGSVVNFDTSAAGQLVKVPAGVGDSGVAGVIVNAQPSAGTSVGDMVDVAYEGEVNVLLDEGATINVGDKVISSGEATGAVITLGTTDSVDIVGVALATKTAGTNDNMIPVRLQIQYLGDNVP